LPATHCLNHLQGEYWIATDGVQKPPMQLSPYCLNHLQGEYWIATFYEFCRYCVAVVGSESSPGRILDCDSNGLSCAASTLTGLNHLQGEYWIATRLGQLHPIGTTYQSLNHLQGEYWIATVLLDNVVLHYCSFRLNHLQGEYWIATVFSLRQVVASASQSESSPGRILDCDLGLSENKQHVTMN